MAGSELSEENYKHIFWINLILTLPLLLLFSWPYYELGDVVHLSMPLRIIGALCFSAPFTLTILHGNVTKAIGTLHRHHFYIWLKKHYFTYGLCYQPIFSSTRFRLALFAISIVIIFVELIFKI